MFEPTDDVDAFLAAPIGRCVVGNGHAIWCCAPDLQGVTLWGPIDEAAIEQLMAIGRFAEHADVAPHRRVLVDCTDVTRVDAEALLAFAERARDRVPAWATELARQAIVVPPGLRGLLLAGAMPALGVAHPLRITQELDAAIEFVDHPSAHAAHARAAEIAHAARGRAAILTRVHRYLAHNLVAATVAACAAELGTSTRSLQRALGGLDTSFSDELRRARVTSAEALLVHSDLKIDAIATRVGFGTASRLSVALRRTLQLNASAVRSRARSARRAPAS